MASSSSSSSSFSYCLSNSPCAACKFLRRKCTSECVFAPYFPPEEPQKFINVHKIFGASNVTKILNDVAPYQREDTVSSLAYEAEARLKDPVYGCVAAISLLQNQVRHLQKELAAAQAELLRYSSFCQEILSSHNQNSSITVTEGTQYSSFLHHQMSFKHHQQFLQQQQQQQQQGLVEFRNIRGNQSLPCFIQPPQHQEQEEHVLEMAWRFGMINSGARLHSSLGFQRQQEGENALSSSPSSSSLLQSGNSSGRNSSGYGQMSPP